MLSVDFLPELEEEAKKRQGRRTDLTSAPDGAEVDHRAVDDAAKLTGASTRNIQRAKRVAAEAIAAVGVATPKKEIAKEIGVSHHTVAGVREESDRNGEIPQSDHLPLERAKQTLRDDPALSQRAAAKTAEVGQATINKARKELEAAGEMRYMA